MLCLLPEVREEELRIRGGGGVETAAGGVAEARLQPLRGGACAVVTHRSEELALAHHALLARVQERGSV